MTRRFAVSLALAFVAALWASAVWAQKGEVKTYEAYEQIDEHNQLPLDPYPPFGLLTNYICYPNQFYGSTHFQVTPRRLRLLVAENEYLKIAMCPDYGGRLYYMYDKVRKREVIHRVYTAAKFYNAGMGRQYVDGGLELNLPNAHSQTNARPRECLARRNGDGSVSLVMSNTEKIGRIHWSVTFTLSPGEARVRQDVRIANEGAVEARYLYWANCGIPLKDNTEYIYPETHGAMHGRYENVFSWPTYEGANLALIKNLQEMLGVYMLDAREGFFGYFSHDDKAGLAHYADVDDVPGKKYWSWGWAEDAQHTRLTHTDGVTYGEVQAGRVVIQEKFDRLAPLTSQVWTEFWYPVGDIGVFNGASENAAIRFSVEPGSGTTASAAIAVQPSVPVRDVSIVIKKGGETVRVLKQAALAPEKPLSLTAEFPCAARDLDRVSLEIVGADGRRLAEVWPKARKSKPFDSYFIPARPHQPAPEEFTAEGLFAEESVLAEDWWYHLPAQKQLLEDCLRLDPGFTRAHTELGIMALQAGQFEEALAHFDKALVRIPDDGRTLYYKGLALRFLDRGDDAHYFLRFAGRFGYEAQERVVEAEMAIRDGDLLQADRHLARSIAVNGTIVKSHVLRALVASRLGDSPAAKRLLDQAAALDPENSFLISARAALAGGTGQAADLVRTRYRMFSEEPLEAVAYLYSAGLYPEAYVVLGLIENNNPVIGLYRSELESILRKPASPRSGPTLGVDFTWRLEEYQILRDLIKLHPQDGELYYHLGNFAYAHDLEQKGIALWEKAYGLGFKDKVSLFSLYRAGKKLHPTDEKNVAYLEEALKLDPNDAYLFDAAVAETKVQQGDAAAIERLEANIGRFMDCFTTVSTLLNEYLQAGAYDKLEAFAGRVHIPYFWSGASLGQPWALMKMARGFRDLKDHKYREALAEFEASGRVPETLEKNYLEADPVKARRLFYTGYCRSKLGDAAGAAEAWKAALDINLHIRFEGSYGFVQMRTRYFQAFCLRGLGRPREADAYVEAIKDFVTSSGMDHASNDAKVHLLELAYLGQETNLDNFDKYDTELGVTSFVRMNTSVEK